MQGFLTSQSWIRAEMLRWGRGELDLQLEQAEVLKPNRQQAFGPGEDTPYSGGQ